MKKVTTLSFDSVYLPELFDTEIVASAGEIMYHKGSKCKVLGVNNFVENDIENTYIRLEVLD